MPGPPRARLPAAGPRGRSLRRPARARPARRRYAFSAAGSSVSVVSSEAASSAASASPVSASAAGSSAGVSSSAAGSASAVSASATGSGSTADLLDLGLGVGRSLRSRLGLRLGGGSVERSLVRLGLRSRRGELGGRLAKLADASLLADLLAQVVELGAVDVADRADLDLLDLRRVHRERPLDADAERLLADGERLAGAGALPLDHDPLEDLDAAALPLDHLEVDANGVPRLEAGNVLAQLALLDALDDRAHGKRAASGRRPMVAKTQISLAPPAARSRCRAGGDSTEVQTRRARCRERAERAAEPGSARREPYAAGGVSGWKCGSAASTSRRPCRSGSCAGPSPTRASRRTASGCHPS